MNLKKLTKSMGHEMTTIKHQGRTLKFAHNIIIFILIFGTTLGAFSQTTMKVIAARDKIAAINAGPNDGIVSGQKYILKRKTGSGVIIVGIVRVEKTLPDKSGIRLIEGRNSSFIQKDDYLGDEIKDKQDEPSKNDDEIITESKKEPSEEQRLKNQLALSGYWVEDGTFYSKKKYAITAFAIYMDQRRKTEALRMVDDGRIKSCSQASALVLERDSPLVFVYIFGIGKVWIYETQLHYN